MKTRDEHYVIDLCDRVLNRKGLRQHRFDFLLGDPGRNGRAGHRLPVDAYYPDLNLVIEFREKQHSEPVNFFDKPERLTCSGCTRGEQRKLYDQRRRDVLKKQGVHLVELDYNLFQCTARKQLCRNKDADETVVRQQLSMYLPSLINS
jgi:hypothetical protein